MRYALLQNGIVIDVVDIDTGVNPLSVFAEALSPTLCETEVQSGWSYDGKKFIRPVPEIAPALEDAKVSLRGIVDAAAETERLKYITPGNGQAMTYQQKVTEAQAFKAETNPNAADYPILSSEVGITAETLDEVANIVLAAFAQWQQIGAAIEAIRLGAKRDIDAAQDEAAARAIVDAIVWPSAQVQP